MAPPCIRPSFFFTRYFTAIRDSAYLVAMPKTPESQHQSTAPGPPRATAVPTPTIFPVPMVAASAVVSAPKLDTSPSASGSLVTESLIPFVMDFHWIKPVLKVIKTWVPRSRIISHQPQTASSMAVITFPIVSIISCPSLSSGALKQTGNILLSSGRAGFSFPVRRSAAAGSQQRPLSILL